MTRSLTLSTGGVRQSAVTVSYGSHVQNNTLWAKMQDFNILFKGNSIG
jgi:hypothetical protein